MTKDSSGYILNTEQENAIQYGDGPLLIIAGAGTGKTTVITERVKNLIMTGRAKADEILALTFTEKGAREMEARIDVALPYGYTQMWVMTFHSFCDQILRDNAIHVGLSPSYKLMTEAQAIDLVRKNLFELDLDYFRPLGNPNKFIDGLLNHFSRLQDELVTSIDYINWVKNQKSKIKNQNDNSDVKSPENLEQRKLEELANAYKKYNELKIKENVMDFGDLIANTLKLFNERPNILKIYQEKFKYLLIDEFQDTNYVQNQLAILLAGKKANITAVGDDDQSIYRFRGAAVSNIVQFRRHFPKTRIIVLTKNYRSTQEILDRSYDLIQHNNPDRLEVVEKISKKLVSVHDKKLKAVRGVKHPAISFIHTENVGDEAREVIKEILELTGNPPSPKATEGLARYEYGDIAILVRANNHADPFIRELERQGIPNQFLGPSNLFEKEEIVDLISYLKVLYNPEDSESFYRLLSSDIFDISPLELIKLSSDAKKTSLSIFEVATESGNKSIKRLLSIIDKHLKVIKKQTAGEILYDYIQEIGLLKKLVENSEDIQAKNIAKFFEKIKSYEDENKNAGVMAVVDYIDLLIEVGESPNVTDGDWQENNAVNILTVHSSKGLEFPIVFLVNLVGERFPGRERHEQIPIPQELIKEVLPTGDFHLQEERRLFYVGMTRAKEKLYFSAADFYGEAKRKKKISPFVLEALGETELSYMPYAVRENKLINTEPKTIQHKAYSIKPVKIDYLSVSQIETFQTCPLHYKLKYIYKLPTKASASSSFGISIHNTLRDFYTKVKEDEKATEKFILELYKDNWIEDGYLNKKHKSEFYKKGESYLLGFLKVGFNKNLLPSLLEEKFIVPLRSSERRGAMQLKIGGTIDRVDDLGNGKVEIIDYKTGANIPTQKEVDKDMQLSFYALAISNIKKIKPENIKLSLYYLDNQERIITTRTASQLEKVKEEILAIREEIENSDFKCNNNFFCQGKCEFSMFCKSN